MPFKGNITKGSHVKVELSVAGSANGSALVAISFADNDDGSGEDSVVVAPGATDTCSVQTNPQPTGRLRVFVDFNDETDTGQLVVSVNGHERNNESLKGDATWAYSLS